MIFQPTSGGSGGEVLPFLNTRGSVSTDSPFSMNLSKSAKYVLILAPNNFASIVPGKEYFDLADFITFNLSSNGITITASSTLDKNQMFDIVAFA